VFQKYKERKSMEKEAGVAYFKRQRLDRLKGSLRKSFCFPTKLMSRKEKKNPNFLAIWRRLHKGTNNYFFEF